MLWLFFCYAARSIIVLTMDKLEYFGKVIKVVTELMDVTERDIISGEKFIAAVDARWLVIRLMHDKGYSTRQIATLVCAARRSVNHALSLFDDRADFSMNDLREAYKTASERLATAEQ